MFWGGRKKPLSCFYCHLIQFIAHLFLCGHFLLVFFFLFSYIRIPVLVAALEQQCFALLRIGHRK